ncbi:hypothetical protein JAAARDRAFT_59038 [Jaapia argillacea MUCL 33604]|uniref:NAD(P)-binding protein n=1 Tax=Jaapia argillacea MUCL 33604 TaxID=933084 RepID=A0A067Q2G9_9AGAM|nr:hypothetical protein JAAARDRAFT_59038 [Jaapia argillacea MUCL 33604]
MAGTSSPQFLSSRSSSVLVWFITGTSSGFGNRLVHTVLGRGDKVIATTRSLATLPILDSIPSPQRLHLPKSDDLHVVELDITEGEESIKAKVGEAVKVWGRIDVLVNNAGCAIQALIEEAGTVETNIFGTLDVTTAVLPYMRARKFGTVVFVGSRTSWLQKNPKAVYAASKAALHSIAQGLSVELAPFSIRVLLVEPGAFLTEGILPPSSPSSTHPATPISDYDSMRTQAQNNYASMIPGTFKGDPQKAMTLLADVVRGEGKAKGKEWPLYLPMGLKAEETMREKWGSVEGVLEEWGEIIRDLDFDEGVDSLKV